jgi:hypothetical protein
MKARQFRYYDFLVHIFVVLLLISNLVGQKITAIGPVRVGGAELLFPITYIFGDVFTEVYGYGASRRAIWIGFFASALLSLMCVFMVWLPPAPGWNNRRRTGRFSIRCREWWRPASSHTGAANSPIPLFSPK